MVMAYNKRPDVFAILTTFRVAEYKEPELPPLPTPRKSTVDAVRPPQTAFAAAQAGNTNVINSDALTYTFEKDSATLTTQVTINVAETAIYGESVRVFDIPVGFSVAYRENGFLQQQVGDMVIGQVSTTSDNVAVSNDTYTVTDHKTNFVYGLGTAVTAYMLSPNSDSSTTYANLLLKSNHLGVAQYHKPSSYIWNMDFDDAGSLYLPTTNRINVNVVVPLLFDNDEAIFEVTDISGLYNLKVSDQTYIGLTFGQVIQTLKNNNFEVVMYEPLE